MPVVDQVIIVGALAERIWRLARRMSCSPTEAIRQALEDQEDLLADGEALGVPSVPHTHNLDGFAALFPVDAVNGGTD
jgi:hypothetical protein